MRVLVDTDVLLDVALKRAPFFESAAEVIRWAQDDPGQAAVAWHSLANVAYLVRPEVAPTGTREAKQAIGFPMADLEDALQTAAALAFEAMFIVTRNTKDYKNSPIPPLSPSKFLVEVGRT
jgi:hypothetical protein